MVIEHNIPLAPFTTIGLGGPAHRLARCASSADIVEALVAAQSLDLPVLILGGGSNMVLPDNGYPGLVIKIEIQGLVIEDSEGHALIRAGAGVSWDELVRASVAGRMDGLACLSGIPGTVGATPIQNVGAYGQEVSGAILSVTAIDRSNFSVRVFSAEECRFGYRTSAFKRELAERFVITEIVFRLRRDGQPVVTYPELRRALGLQSSESAETPVSLSAAGVRERVLDLRRAKSMVIDPSDSNTRSCGSFFVNPVISSAHFRILQDSWETLHPGDPVPSYPAGSDVKVPAAWLVERAGFPRGYRFGGVGVSQHHALALVNLGGTAAELLELADRIQKSVRERFGVSLEVEPVIVSPPAR